MNVTKQLGLKDSREIGQLLLNLNDEGDGFVIPGSSYIPEERQMEVARKISFEMKKFLRVVRYTTAAVAFLLICVPSWAECGIASWYATAGDHTDPWKHVWTASGERFNENALTCAMPGGKFGRLYRVTNLLNGRSVVVRHNDKGPGKHLQKKGRVIDLTKGAFKKIAGLNQGVTRVRVEAL